MLSREAIISFIREADLQWANLRWADLEGANLEGANLCKVDLAEADLRGADLRGADLEGADLYGAYLQGADLRWANLQKADLRKANLRGADLEGADLEGADFRFSRGNNRQIKTLQMGVYRITYTSDVMAIGCEQHSIDEWMSFDDCTISQMDSDALKFWGKWKPILKSIMEIEG